MPRRDDYEDDDFDDNRYARPSYRFRRDDEYDRRSRDDDYDDYDDDGFEEVRPNRMRSRTRAAEKVLLPAIFLMIVGSLGFCLSAVNTALIAAGHDDGNPFVQNDPNMRNDPAYKMGQVVGSIFALSWGPIVFAGGLKPKSLSGRGFVTFACIWAMVPCNACCMLGIPFGIWALVALNDPSVKRVF